MRGDRKIRKIMKEVLTSDPKGDNFEVVKMRYGLEYEGVLYFGAICLGNFKRRTIMLTEGTRDLERMSEEEWQEFRRTHERTEPFPDLPD